MTASTSIPVHGECASQFAAVRDVFTESFARQEEVGAAVCVYADGQKVVDLWGGYCDEARSQPWQADTIVCMFSVAKGMAALCAHVLADRGLLDIDAPVVTYWPEFGKQGKERITVKQVLGHMAALVYTDTAPPGALFEPEVMVKVLEDMSPAWEPGTRGAYHSSTYGNLVGEIVRRVSGKSIGRFFREEIAEPLGLDYHIGLGADELERVCDIIPNPANETAAVLSDPTTKPGRSFAALPRQENVFNSLTFRQIEWPSANGHGNARSVARLFAALARGGEIDGVRVLSPEAIAHAAELQWDDQCLVWGDHFRTTLGLLLNTPDFAYMGPNPNSFGTAGAGGACGIADPRSRIGFGYSPNFMCAGGGLGERSRALVEATFASV